MFWDELLVKKKDLLQALGFDFFFETNFRNLTRSLNPRIGLTEVPFPKNQFIIASRKTSTFETY